LNKFEAELYLGFPENKKVPAMLSQFLLCYCKYQEGTNFSPLENNYSGLWC